MNEVTIGGQIARLRRAAGITQEELGRAAGVSTQAVSRWECGGTPDVSLLPAIADRLGVSIDALFGREGGEPVDMERALGSWLRGQPKEQEMSALCHLVWSMCEAIAPTYKVGRMLSRYLDTCQIEDLGESSTWLRTKLVSEQGLMLGVGAKDLEFMTIFPEPAAGYAAYLSSGDSYRQLFSCLAMPCVLELLAHFFSEKPCYYTPDVAAARTGMSREQVCAAMVAMAEVHLLEKIEVATAEGSVDAYIVRDNGAYVPFLYLARWMMEKNDSYYMNWEMRKAPYLRKETRHEGP